MFADRTGGAVLIEANTIYRKKGRHLLATNFRLSSASPGSSPCRRFRIADRMLRESSAVSVDLFRRILAAVHMENSTPTQYSAIFDLKRQRIHLYHYHNFESVVTIDVPAELAKGWHAVDLASLFAPTFAALNYVGPLKEPVTGVILAAIADDGIEGAASKYQFMRDFEDDRYDSGPSPVNVAGLELMWAGKTTAAVKWLEFAVETFPEEQDSLLCLGDAYAASGDRQSARRCYEELEKLRTAPWCRVAEARLAELDDSAKE
jgi:hypothetical protein